MITAARHHQNLVLSASALAALLLFSPHAIASTQTQLLLSRDTTAQAVDLKGVVELTVDPGFEAAKVNVAVDGDRIATALRSPWRVTVDFGPRVIEHKITVTATGGGNQRVQWTETVNRGHNPLTVKVKAVDAAQGIFEAATTANDDDPIAIVEVWENGSVIASKDKPPYRFQVPADTLARGFVQVTAKSKSGEEAADFWSSGGEVHVENMEVRTVPLYVSVVDRNGTTRDDVDRSLFRITDGSSVGKIVEFGKAFNQPISIALLVDASGSMNGSMQDASKAANEFVRNTLKSGDRCAVFAIQSVPRRELELTSDRQQIDKALKEIRANGETALYDGIASAIRELRGEKNRRAIVVLTDGADNSSNLSYEEIEKMTREAGIPVYFITYSTGEPTGARDIDRMAFIAGETGGFLTAATQSDLPARYAQIEKDLRAQFAIVYEVADFAKKNEWRKVKVSIASPKLSARTIGGYFAP